MRLSKGKLILISSCVVISTQWIDGPINISGKAVFFVSELILYLHVLFLLAIGGWKLTLPKRIFKILVPLVIYLLIHLIYSLFFADAGNAILTTRRLIYYPAIALIIGYNTSKIAQQEDFVHKLLNLNLKVSVPLLLINVLIGFHMFQEFGFISRATGVILSSIVFYGLLLLINENRVPKGQALASLAALLIVFTTSSRGVYLSFFMVLALLTWQHRRKIGVVRIIKLASAGIVSLGVIISIALSSPLVIKTLERFRTDIVNLASGNMGKHGDEFNTLGARYYLYEAAINLGLESPVFGNGSGFKVEQWHIGGTYNIDRSKTAHNHYLDIWYRLGAVGLLLFFLFYRNLLVELKKKQESVYYMMIVALIYSSFDVMLSSTISAIIPIFMLVGASMYDYRLTIVNK
jgi:O-antigen ligase